MNKIIKNTEQIKVAASGATIWTIDEINNRLFMNNGWILFHDKNDNTVVIERLYKDAGKYSVEFFKRKPNELLNTLDEVKEFIKENISIEWSEKL